MTFDVSQDESRAILAMAAQGGNALTITDDEVTPPQGGGPSLHRFKIAAAASAVPGSKQTLRSMAVWPSRDDANWASSFDVQIATPQKTSGIDSHERALALRELDALIGRDVA